MKVCAIVPVPHGGRNTPEMLLERSWPSVEHARGLAQAGAQVHLLFDAPFFDRLQLRQGVTVHFVRGPDARHAAHLVPAAWALRPDLVHFFHLMATPAFALCAAAARAGGPVVAEYNGGAPAARPTLRSRLRRGISLRASGRLLGCFFSAAPIAEPFVQAGFLSPTTPIWELPQISSRLSLRSLGTSAYDAHRNARTQLRWGPQPRVLAVARVEAPKDPQCTLETFAKVQRARPDARLLWIAKGGAQMSEIQAQIREEGLSVQFEHGLGPEQMALRYAASDVLIHTSHREVCGAAFSEALSMGLPIVSTRIPSFEAKAHPQAVVLCPRSDPETFARGTLSFLTHNAKEARQVAKTHFDERLSFAAIGKRRLQRYARALSEAK